MKDEVVTEVQETPPETQEKSNIFGEMAEQQSAEDSDESSLPVEPDSSDESTEKLNLEEESASEEDSPKPQPNDSGEDDGVEAAEEDSTQDEAEASTELEETATTLQVPTFEVLQEKLQENRIQSIEKLQERYKMSEEDVEAYLDNPQEMLPKMAAGVFWDAYTSIWATVVTEMPRLMEQVNQINQSSSSAVEKFFSRYTELDPQKDGEVIKRIAINYRAQNPQATLDQIIEDVGLLALHATGKHKIANKNPKPIPSAGNPPPKPAAISGRSRAAPASSSDNIFTQMVEELPD